MGEKKTMVELNGVKMDSKTASDISTKTNHLIDLRTQSKTDAYDKSLLDASVFKNLVGVPLVKARASVSSALHGLMTGEFSPEIDAKYEKEAATSFSNLSNVADTIRDNIHKSQLRDERKAATKDALEDYQNEEKNKKSDGESKKSGLVNKFKNLFSSGEMEDNIIPEDDDYIL